MKADGKALVIITHKLHEVMDVSDRVAVLRKGRYIGDVATCDTSPQKLTDMMVGHAVTLNIDRPLVEDRNLRLEVKDLTVLTPDGIKALDHVSFDAYGGEILGIAGISGSGQKELLEAIAGLRVTQPGSHVIYHPPPPTNPSPVSMCRWTRAVRSCWARIPGRSTTSACPWPLCRRTG